MNKNIIILILFAGIFTFSCKSNKENSFEIKRTVEFNTGYADVFFRFLGSVNGDEPFVYFSDRNNSIQFFDFNGQKTDSIKFSN